MPNYAELIPLLALLLLLAVPRAAAQDVRVQVDQTLKADGISRFNTIQSALDHAPEVSGKSRLTIEIAPGTYDERVYVSQFRAGTILLGMGKSPSDVVITAGQNGKTSQSTFFSETVEILAEDFSADNLTFANSAGATGQALAASVTADRAIFKRCRFLGFQDTLFANYGRQYYVDSYISGAVDFIFGNAAAVFDHSEIHATRPGYLTAQSRTSAAQATGFVFVKSKVTADDTAGKTIALGRPWRQFSRVVFLDTELPASIDPKGWNDWGRDPSGVYYAERGSTGPGASGGRVSWARKLSAEEAEEFLPGPFLAGSDSWDPVAEAAKLP